MNDSDQEADNLSCDRRKIIITYPNAAAKRIGFLLIIQEDGVDAEDESELEAAKRELREETGLVFKNWKLVEVSQPFSKIDWLVYTFVASELVTYKHSKS